MTGLIVESLTLVSIDGALPKYDVGLLAADR